MCAAENLPSFATVKALKEFFDSLPAITLGGWINCLACGGFHAAAHMRDDHGEGIISASVQQHNGEMSRRDAHEFSWPPGKEKQSINHDDTPNSRRNAPHRNDPNRPGSQHHPASFQF